MSCGSLEVRGREKSRKLHKVEPWGGGGRVHFSEASEEERGWLLGQKGAHPCDDGPCYRDQSFAEHHSLGMA